MNLDSGVSSLLIDGLFAIRNENGLLVLEMLKKNGEMRCKQIEKHFFLTPTAVNAIIQKLYKAGLLIKRESGRETYYSANRDNIAHFLKSLREVIT